MIAVLFALLAVAGVAPAMQLPGPVSVATAAELNEHGTVLLQKNQYDEARAAFEPALALSREQKDTRQEAEAVLGIGNTYFRKGEYPSAATHVEKALALFESLDDSPGLAKAYRLRGALGYSLGDPQKSLADYRQALVYAERDGDLRMRASILLNITFTPTLSIDEQLGYLRESAEIARQTDDTRLLASIFHNWGDALTAASRFAEANEQLERAAALFEPIGDRDALARVFTSMGRLLRLHGQPEKAIEMYRRALTIQEKTGDRTGIIQSHNAMGVAYDAMRNYRQAGELYRRGLDLALASGSDRIIDFMTGAVAGNFLDLEDYARAADLLEKIVARGKDARLDLRYVSLARAYHKLGRYPAALAAANTAISMRRSLQSTFEQHDALALRASILAKLSRPEDALADVRESMRLVEDQRAKAIPADVLKSGYSETVQRYYSLALDFLIQAGRGGEALAIAEQGRARAFLDLLATREMSLRKDSAASLAELRRVDASLREEGANPGEFMPERRPTLLTRGPAEPPAPTATFWNRWKNGDPELRSFVTAEAFTATDLAATARRLNSTILSYWVGDETTYIWVVRSDGAVHVATSAVGWTRLVQLISRATADAQMLGNRGEADPRSEDTGHEAIVTRGGVTVRFDPASRAAWRELYDVLIRPVRDRLPGRAGSRITVVPHGPLFRLSFAALPDAEGRYLIERHELHYVPAGAVLDFTKRKAARQANRNGSYLLIADPANPPAGDDRRLAPLPGARDEVASTSRLLPTGRSTILNGSAATETRVRSEMRSQSVIHFATHGIVRDDSPLDSFLALGASVNAGGDDGRLTVQDVYALELNAELVFLSACRSARGKVTGDGVIGLTRSFVYAGTPTVVATLWDVADETTRRLVPQFYRGYLPAGSAARALRAAQLQLIADLRASRVHVATPVGPVVLPEHPSLWAAFAVFGEP